MADKISTKWGHEPFTRVHLDGVDVTDEPERWPWPYSAYRDKGWRPGMPWDNRYRPDSPRVPREKKK